MRASRVLFPWFSVTAVAATVLFACGTSTNAVDAADAGTEASSPTDDAASLLDATDAAAPACSTTHTFGSRKCSECASEKCCSNITECQGNAKCKARMDCTLGCIDEVDARACAQDCEAEHGDPDGGDVQWFALQNCVYVDKVNGCYFLCGIIQ